METHFEEVGGMLGEWLAGWTWHFWNWRDRGVYYAALGHEEEILPDESVFCPTEGCTGRLLTCRSVEQNAVYKCEVCTLGRPAQHATACNTVGCQGCKMCYECMVEWGVLRHMHPETPGRLFRFRTYVAELPDSAN